MIFPKVWPKGRGGPARKQINRAPSPLLALSLPWVFIALMSVLTTIVFIASAPVMPPLGFLAYIAWRQLRPGLLPVWAGLPLGLFDDLYSGQPFGSAVMLWSLAAIALDFVETRLPWRNFITEWTVAAVLIALYICSGLVLANLAVAKTPILFIVPQICISILFYPLVGRAVALFDRVRLMPITDVG